MVYVRFLETPACRGAGLFVERMLESLLKFHLSIRDIIEIAQTVSQFAFPGERGTSSLGTLQTVLEQGGVSRPLGIAYA